MIQVEDILFFTASTATSRTQLVPKLIQACLDLLDGLGVSLVPNSFKIMYLEKFR